MISEEVNQLFHQQLKEWDLAGKNFEALQGVKIKELTLQGIPYKVQFNPARIVSSAAKVDKKSIQERKCFLCADNRPKEQRGIPYNGYEILINPFPIFPRHLTIPDCSHTPQRIKGRFGAMLALSKELPDYTLFYNGPKCGASAPDHMHFQAGNKGFMPIEDYWEKSIGETIFQTESSKMVTIKNDLRNTIIIESSSAKEAEQLFEALYSCLPVHEGEEEPMMNLLSSYRNGKWIIFVFPRKKHRPSCYFAEGEKQILSSPASVDLGGVFILPLEKDFIQLDEKLLSEILLEVSPQKEDMDRIIQQLRNLLENHL